jgi:hypothetical protein
MENTNGTVTVLVADIVSMAGRATYLRNVGSLWDSLADARRGSRSSSPALPVTS